MVDLHQILYIVNRKEGFFSGKINSVGQNTWGDITQE